MTHLSDDIGVSIVVPTYNERENVCPLCDAIRSSLAGEWRCEIIFVDDNSPDGTSEEIRRLPTHGFFVKLLERPAKLGLGNAVVEGFQAALGDSVLLKKCYRDGGPHHLRGPAVWEVQAVRCRGDGIPNALLATVAKQGKRLSSIG